MELGLSGKSVVVTGASRGIGRSISVALAREGARLLLVARGEADLKSAVAQVHAAGGDAQFLVADVSTEAGARAAIDGALAHHGRLEILINNAGGSLGTGAFEKTTLEDWKRVLDLNLWSAIYTSRAAVDHMKATGGVIVNINSVCGRELCGSSAYTTAKTAMTAMTKEMAVSLAKHRIRVNGVAPGSVLFPGGSHDLRRIQDPARHQKMIDEQLPWGRFGTPEEIANVVTFLCSNQASWVTGATIPVDGGQGRAF